jgi:hypothetical protein
VTVSVTPVAIPFPASVADVSLSGSLIGVFLTAGQNAPEAIVTIAVPADQTMLTDHQPVMVNNRPLEFHIGPGGYFPIPLEAQALPANIQLQVRNAGAATSISIVTSAP